MPFLMIPSHNNAFSLSDIQSVQTNDKFGQNAGQMTLGRPAFHFYYCKEDCVCVCVFVRKKWLSVSESVPAVVK